MFYFLAQCYYGVYLLSLSRTFCEEEVLSPSAKDHISTMGKECQSNPQDESRVRNFGDKNGPQAVYIVLDNMLKDSLDRLQKMRLALIS